MITSITRIYPTSLKVWPHFCHYGHRLWTGVRRKFKYRYWFRERGRRKEKGTVVRKKTPIAIPHPAPPSGQGAEQVLWKRFPRQPSVLSRLSKRRIPRTTPPAGSPRKRVTLRQPWALSTWRGKGRVGLEGLCLLGSGLPRCLPPPPNPPPSRGRTLPSNRR